MSNKNKPRTFFWDVFFSFRTKSQRKDDGRLGDSTSHWYDPDLRSRISPFFTYFLSFITIPIAIFSFFFSFKISYTPMKTKVTVSESFSYFIISPEGDTIKRKIKKNELILPIAIKASLICENDAGDRFFSNEKNLNFNEDIKKYYRDSTEWIRGYIYIPHSAAYKRTNGKTLDKIEKQIGMASQIIVLEDGGKLAEFNHVIGIYEDRKNTRTLVVRFDSEGKAVSNGFVGYQTKDFHFFRYFPFYTKILGSPLVIQLQKMSLYSSGRSMANPLGKIISQNILEILNFIGFFCILTFGMVCLALLFVSRLIPNPKFSNGVVRFWFNLISYLPLICTSIAIAFINAYSIWIFVPFISLAIYYQGYYSKKFDHKVEYSRCKRCGGWNTFLVTSYLDSTSWNEDKTTKTYDKYSDGRKVLTGTKKETIKHTSHKLSYTCEKCGAVMNATFNI